MNSLFFGLLMVVCAFQASNADMLSNMRDQLQRAQNNVDSILNDISRTKSNVQFSTQMKLSNKKSEYMGQINGFVNPALAQIRSDVDSANAGGKNAENCYDTAKDSLRTASLNGFSGLDRCESDAKNALSQSLNVLSAQESTGNAIKADLSGIFPSCYSSNMIQMSSCIAIKLGGVNSTIRTWESTVNTAKFQANSDSNRAFLSMNTCGMNVVSSTRSATTDARIAANNCIKNA